MSEFRTRNDYMNYLIASSEFRALEKSAELFQNANAEFENDISNGKIQSNEDFQTVVNSGKLDLLNTSMFKVRSESFKVIVFSLMCVEALINEYGHERLGKKYFETHLDKLDIKSKWIIIPRLVNGKTINKDGQAYEHLVYLTKKRNSIIHPKPINAQNIQKEQELINESFQIIGEVPKCFKTCELLIKELEQIDPNFSNLKIYKDSYTRLLKVEQVANTIYIKNNKNAL